MIPQPLVIALAALFATATIGYGGYLGYQMTELWYAVGKVEGRQRCGVGND